MKDLLCSKCGETLAGLTFPGVDDDTFEELMTAIDLINRHGVCEECREGNDEE